MMMAMLQVLYSLEDISYDVQQSYFSGLKDKKRQKTGKVTALLPLCVCVITWTCAHRTLANVSQMHACTRSAPRVAYRQCRPTTLIAAVRPRVRRISWCCASKTAS
jgi:hypothetical protein